MYKGMIFAFIIVVLISCDSGNGSGSASEKTISGTVTNGSGVVIGAFSSDYYFSSGVSGDEDVVASETGVTAGTYTPLVKVTPGSDGAYSITLPDDPVQMGELIAWADTDADGSFDLGTETGYLPQKYIEGAARTINTFGYLSYGGEVYYLVSYSIESVSYNDGFDIVGTGGFDFTIH